MTDLSTKPCTCGSTLDQIIGWKERSTDQAMVPSRVGWYCGKCQNIEQAVGRETWVDENDLIANKDKKRLEKALTPE